MAWLFGSLVTYFVLGFLKNFYPAAWQLVLWGVAYQTLVVTTFYYLACEIAARFTFQKHLLNLLLLLMVFAFSGAVVWLLSGYPNWFDADFFLLPAAMLPWFTGLLIFSALWGIALLIFLAQRGLETSFPSSRFFGSLRANLPGLVLALAFFSAYFSLAVTYSLVLRDPTQNFDDNFFDADPTSWMNRFAAPASQLIEMRPVHPFAFLIFRPLTWLVALFLNGNAFHAALLLNAGVGALCVFLTWLVVKRWSNSTYALTIASLLGVSTAHLILSTYLETYIFSAAALIAFVLVMQSEQRSLKTLVPIGLLTFGITITNIIQTGIIFLFTDFKLSKLIKYGLIVLVAAVALAYLQVLMYPTSQPFYDPSKLLAENRYSAGSTTPERIYQRSYVLGRTIALFSVVGPRPLPLTKEVGCTFPCFKTYKPRYGADLITSYAGFGSWLARAWFGILLLAFGFFAWKLIKSPKDVSLQLALLTCLLFNFGLHVAYGDDPMLYSPDWTYALILFVSISFKDFADKKWFQFAGFVFLAALMVNNWTFLRSVLVAVAPYF